MALFQPDPAGIQAVFAEKDVVLMVVHGFFRWRGQEAQATLVDLGNPLEEHLFLAGRGPDPGGQQNRAEEKPIRPAGHGERR